MKKQKSFPEKSPKQEQNDKALLAIRAAVLQHGIPSEIYVDIGAEILPRKSVSKMKNQAFYEKIIQGKRKAECATEAVIARTTSNAGMVLAYIGIHHPASELVFRYFVAQNYPDLRKRLLLPGKAPVSDSDAEIPKMLFPNRQNN